MRESIIRIAPFELLNLLECTVVKRENEHGYLRFSGYISAELEDSYVEMALNEFWATASAIDEAGQNKVIFCGVVTDLSVRTENGVKTLAAVLRSGTYLMDTMPHTRSYQNPGTLYKAVLSSFTMDYQNGKFIMTEGKQDPIQDFILQYNETDWEFAKRLATHFHTVLIPNTKTAGVKYFFGLPEGADSETIDTNSYSMEKKVEEFICKQKNGVQGLRERDVIYYIVTVREIYELGACVVLNGQALYVCEIHSELVGSELYHSYYLKRKNGFMVPRYNQSALIGVSLDATILAVAKDQVQVTIQEDENKSDTGVRWFPYSTVYSAPDGTGWYCMPEIGDAVRLYLPDSRERNAYIISSTHLLSSAGDERVNPDCKSIMNKYGKEILFTPGSLVITNNAGMSIELVDGEGIKMTSNKAIIIKSDEAVDISSATSTLQVVAPKSISLQQGGTNMLLQDNVTFRGAQIHMD